MAAPHECEQNACLNLHKNVTCCFEQIVEAALHKTAVSKVKLANA